MIDQDYDNPRKVFDRRLPEMDLALRRRVLTIATNVTNDFIFETGARERTWKSRQPKAHHIARRIRKSELKVERRLLAIMDQELKKQHGMKHWRKRQILALAAEYRRLRVGRGISGVAAA